MKNIISQIEKEIWEMDFYVFWIFTLSLGTTIGVIGYKILITIVEFFSNN